MAIVAVAAKTLKLSARTLISTLSKSTGKLRKIKTKRKTLMKMNSNLKKRKMNERKLEMNTSPLKRSSGLSKLGGSVAGSITKFVSILLLGTLINNIKEIKKKYEELKEKFDKKIEQAQDSFVVKQFNNFINFFTGTQPSVEDTMKNNENLYKDFEEIENAAMIIEQNAKLVDNAEKNDNKIELPTEGNLFSGDAFKLNMKGDVPDSYTITKLDGKKEKISLSKFNDLYQKDKKLKNNLLNSSNKLFFNEKDSDFNLDFSFDPKKFNFNFDDEYLKLLNEQQFNTKIFIQPIKVKN